LVCGRGEGEEGVSLLQAREEKKKVVSRRSRGEEQKKSCGPPRPKSGGARKGRFCRSFGNTKGFGGFVYVTWDNSYARKKGVIGRRGYPAGGKDGGMGGRKGILEGGLSGSQIKKKRNGKTCRRRGGGEIAQKEEDV